VIKGSRPPADNRSAYLLDVHRRAIPGRKSMRRFADNDEVDLCIVGAGPGGSVLAQRLARRGWRIVVLESGPFWDPDRDWISDEAGQQHLYWNATRVIGGSDPVELGKNNSGHGVGGSMVHFAGFAPRFHPSDFATKSLDGVGADWPIDYQDLKPHYETVERELPVAGQDWPWGDPHSYPHSPHPISAAASKGMEGALAAGIDIRVGPVAIPNGAFGNRPHCIYRGFCLQGCKVNAKASPLVTHLPDAIDQGVEIRANSHAVRVEVDETGRRCTGVTYDHGHGELRTQRARMVAAQLNKSPLAAWSRQRPRSGRPLRDGAGCASGRGSVPRTAEAIQGAAARDLLRTVLRNRPSPGFRARLRDSDGRTATNCLGRARHCRRPLGTRAT
jgi:hypothetical protein